MHLAPLPPTVVASGVSLFGLGNYRVLSAVVVITFLVLYYVFR